MLLVALSLALFFGVARPVALMKAKGDNGHYPFDNDVMTLWCELLKFVIVALLLGRRFWSVIRAQLMRVESLLLAVPSICYATVSVLEYNSLSLVPWIVVAVVGRTHIVTTAVLARLVLGKRLSAARWLAVALLLAGTTLPFIVTSNATTSDAITAADRRIAVFSLTHDTVNGVLLMLLAAVISGVNGVYTERMLKRPQPGVNKRSGVDDEGSETQRILDRMLQLHFYGAVFVFALDVTRHGDAWTRALLWLLSGGGGGSDRGALLHMTTGMASTWSLALLLVTALNGISTGLVIASAGAVEKTFVQSLAMAVSVGLDCVIERIELTPLKLASIALVITSTIVYVVKR